MSCAADARDLTEENPRHQMNQPCAAGTGAGMRKVSDGGQVFSVGKERCSQMEIQKDPEENVRLRWLEGEACLTARPLWEEVFSEDSAAFTEYYFTQKAVRNRGAVLEGEDGLRAMLYLTPEKLRVKGSTVDSAYIVGVATREQYRHRGYMSRLLRESMTALAREGMPFAFLMPASPDIYTPFGFVWIYDRPVWDAGTLRRDRLRALGADEADRTARFASDLLEKEKAVYVLRDAAYYRLQDRELAAQNGCVLGYEEAGQLKGICMYTHEETEEIPEILADAETEARFASRRPEKKPAIMARILCVEAMLPLVRCRERMDFALRLSDPLVEENNAFFVCRSDGAGGRIRCRRETHPEGKAPVIRMSIAELTAVLFGRCRTEQEALRGLEPLSPVWINEIV